MSAPASSPPVSAHVEIGLGTASSFAGVLLLVTRLPAVPGFVDVFVTGFTPLPDFWPIVTGLLLVVAGVLLLLRGRYGLRVHRRAVARREAALERARYQQAPGGVSAGVGGTPHRVPARR